MHSSLSSFEANECRTVLEWIRKQSGVRYAEIRFVSEMSEHVKVRDGRPEGISTSTSRGIAIRVLGLTWGFSCTSRVTLADMQRAAEDALLVAHVSARCVKTAIPFPEREAQRGHYETPVVIDPFTISLETKLSDLDAAVKILLAGGKPVTSAEAWMDWTKQSKRLFTTEGTDVEQDFVFGNVGMHVYATSTDGDSQRRSYPTWQGGEGFQAGYERVRELDLTSHAPRLRAEVIALLKAPPCPTGVFDLVLDSSQVALQIHESCGHPTELDRALGSEISLAGGSFMQPSMLGTLKYGSPMVNLVVDSTAPTGMGTFGWDDEGTPAGNRAIISNGIFVDYLSSRETAAQLGRESTAAMRAESWNRTPLIRMANVSLQPGEGTLDDLIGGVKHGIYVETDKSWSIDDLRLNFQFSCELAWEIKNGKRSRLLRDPFYTGITTNFWRSCDAIAGKSEWKLWGINSCGKGDPMQIMQVGHGASPARFRNVTMGAA